MCFDLILDLKALDSKVEVLLIHQNMSINAFTQDANSTVA